MDYETLWYEASPYIYTFAGICTALSTELQFGKISGILLLAAALTIIRLRWRNRRKT